MGSVEFELRRYDRQQSERESHLDAAEKQRAELVERFMESDKNDTKMNETLLDLTAGDKSVLHAILRSDGARARKLLTDAIDFAYGDEIVNEEAERLEIDREEA